MTVPMTTADLDRKIAANRQLVTRATLPVAAGAGALAFVLIVLALFVGWITLVLAVLVAGAGAFAYRRITGGGEAEALRLSGARPATLAEHPRLHNVIEGLSAASGVPAPSLHVVADPVPNAFMVGREARTAALVVTSGLLEQLEPVELEGVLAQQLVHARNLDIWPATVAVAFPPLRSKLDPDRELEADRAAIGITRYPPGLRAGLEKVRAGRGEAGTTASPALAHLWTDRPGVTSPALDLRIDVLGEL